VPENIEQYRPLAKVLMRLMGVWFIISGVTSLVGNGADLYGAVREVREMGYGITTHVYTSLGWTVAAVLTTLAGLYLLFGGRVVLDALFHESIEPRSPSPDAKGGGASSGQDTDVER
jgi:uncharacterized membrane protein YphA (DoxX/SURF4 family)